jgi:hypothetical protein
MSPQTAKPTALKSLEIPVQMMLAAAWTSFMFLYIYVDFLGLYKPGVVNGILNGKIWEFDVSQAFMVAGLASVAIPAVMILASAALPARANRATNLVVASLYIPYSAFNLAGGDWLYYYGFGLVIELVILAFILRSAWTWPRTQTASMPVPTLKS